MKYIADSKDDRPSNLQRLAAPKRALPDMTGTPSKMRSAPSPEAASAGAIGAIAVAPAKVQLGAPERIPFGERLTCSVDDRGICRRHHKRNRINIRSDAAQVNCKDFKSL
jgi:hypothetical protein